MFARSGVRPHKNLDNYIAIATGSMSTKRNFPQYYNPSDTQRDIIWVEKDNPENQLLCISSNNNSSAKPAGLQVKASHDGLRYILPQIEQYHYPILYFDLGGDWGVVAEAIRQKYSGCSLINPDEIHHAIKHALKGYFDIIVSIFRGETTIPDVIRGAKHKGDSIIDAGIAAAEANSEVKIILPSHVSAMS